MKDMELKDIGIDEFKCQIYPYYLETFPKDERKSLELLQLSYEKKYTKFIEILYKNEIVGFMIINKVKDKGYVWLDYFAILPQYRNNKLGTKALEMLLNQEDSGVFVEIEKVGLGKNEKENFLREKRKNFYEKIGFKKLSVDFLLFNVVYTPYIFLKSKEPEDKVINNIFNIYETVLGKEKVKQNCKVIKEDEIIE